MFKSACLVGCSFALLLWGLGVGSVPACAQPRAGLEDASQTVLFRTKSYVAQIIWRRGIPYLSVSYNGWRVLADVRAAVLPSRGVGDRWTTYTAAAGDYQVYVRVGATGGAAIEVTQAGRRLREEYAIAPRRQLLPQPGLAQPDNTVLRFETSNYVVRVFRQQGELWMNLYNKATATTDLRQVPVTFVNTSDGMVYRHNGAATIQAREDTSGRRSLLIIRDNAIQYRGEAL